MRSPFIAIATPEARGLWLMGLGVNVARWLDILVFALLALKLTGSPFWVAAMTVARMLPLLSGALLTSAVAGRATREVLGWLFLVLTLVSLGLCLLALLDRLALWHLLLAALIGGFAWTLETPVRRMALADAAGLERVQASMGLEVVSNQITRIIGPALGGLLLDTGGIVGVFLCGTIVHGLCLWGAWRLAKVAAPRGAGAAGGLRRAMAEGFTYVRRHRLLTGTVMLTAVFNLWGFPYISLVPVIGETVLGLSPTGIGLMMAADAIGALIAAFIIMQAARPADFARLYSFSVLLFLSCTLSIGFIASVPLATLALFMAGIGMAGFNAMQISLPIQATPAAMRVRVMGILTVAIGAAPFGFLHAGLLAEWLGAPLAQRIIAAEGLMAFSAVLYIWPELIARKPAEPLKEGMWGK